MKTIQEIVEDYGIDIKTEGKLLRAYCPFHEDTGRPNFTLYPETSSWFCFACSIGGDAAEFVAKIEGISRNQALVKLSDVEVELADLSEKLEQLQKDTSNTTQALNQTTNVWVSNKLQEYLKKYPEYTKQFLRFAEYFDEQLQHELSYQEAERFLQTILTLGDPTNVSQ